MTKLSPEEKASKKRTKRLAEEANQRPVESITITIEWKKSRTWGSNPHAVAKIYYKPLSSNSSNFAEIDGFRASGCGYDKESTVIAEIFNKTLKYKLHEKNRLEHKNNSLPYGVRYWEINGILQSAYYEGGVGTSCYYDIALWLGGKFEHIASGKSFDVFKYTDND